MTRQANHLSILIVGVHPNVCCGLKALLKTSPVVGEVQVASYSTVQDILESETMPDVVFFDEGAEGDKHNATISTLNKLFPKSHIIILTLTRGLSTQEKESCLLSKSAGTEDLMLMIQNIARKGLHT